MKKFLTVAVGGLMTLGVSNAQVVTPPSPAPAKTPDYVPPPAEPKAERPAASAPRQPTKRTTSIPRVDYKPLVEKDADGKYVPLSDTPQRLALEEVHNPFVKAEDRARLADYMAKRDHRMEMVAVDNLDLIEKIETGEINRLDFVTPENQRQSFTTARALTDPINPFGDLISDMARRQLLTDVQAAMADKLCNEYRTALREASRGEGSRRVDPTWMARFTYNNKAQEALVAIGRVRAAAVANAAEVLPKTGLDSALVSKLVEACKNAPPDAKGQAEMFGALGKDLSIEQRRAWLKAAMATRPMPQGEPLVPFPKNTGRRPAGEDPNAEPGAEQGAEPGAGEPGAAEPTEAPHNN